MRGSRAGHALVEFEESEHVVARGVRRMTWWVREGQRWVPAGDVAGAEVAALAKGRGTIWYRSVKLELAVGTIVAHIITEPLPARARSPLEHLLMTPNRSGIRRTRSAYRVDAAGSLTRLRRVEAS